MGVTVAVGAVLVFALVMSVVSGATTPANPGTFKCTPATLTNSGRCQLAFTDRHARIGYGASPAAGHLVCFSVKQPNVIRATSHNCSNTNRKGIATATFTAKAAGKINVSAQEWYHKVYEGKKLITIRAY